MSFISQRCLICRMQMLMFEKPLLKSTIAIYTISTMLTPGNISNRSIARAPEKMSSRASNIYTTNGILSRQTGSFPILACTITYGQTTTPTTVCVHMGTDLLAAGGIDRCSKLLRIIDFTAPSSDKNTRILYAYNSSTNNRRIHMECSGKRFKSKHEINSTRMIQQHGSIK